MKFTNEKVIIPKETKLIPTDLGNLTACYFRAFQSFDKGKTTRFNNYQCVCYDYDVICNLITSVSGGMSIYISGYDKQVIKDGKLYYNYIITKFKLGEKLDDEEYNKTIEDDNYFGLLGR